MRTDALQLVMEGPPEDWGERWLVMERCLRHYDPSRGPLSHYYSRALAFNQFNTYRVTTKRGRFRSVQFEDEWAHPPAPPVQEPPEMPACIQTSRQRERDLAVVNLLARGATYDAIAAGLQMPLGSVKSVISRLRAFNAA